MVGPFVAPAALVFVAADGLELREELFVRVGLVTGTRIELRDCGAFGRLLDGRCLVTLDVGLTIIGDLASGPFTLVRVSPVLLYMFEIQKKCQNML